MTWEELIKDMNHWLDTAIPHTAQSDVFKFQEESLEFIAEPSAEEAADIIMVLMHYCHLEGHDLKKSMIDKLEKNKKRSWSRQGDGTWHHIKDRS